MKGHRIKGDGRIICRFAVNIPLLLMINHHQLCFPCPCITCADCDELDCGIIRPSSTFADEDAVRDGALTEQGGSVVATD